MDRNLIKSLLLAGIAYYYTRDVMPALAVGGASYVANTLM